MTRGEAVLLALSVALAVQAASANLLWERGALRAAAAAEQHAVTRGILDECVRDVQRMMDSLEELAGQRARRRSEFTGAGGRNHMRKDGHGRVAEAFDVAAQVASLMGAVPLEGLWVLELDRGWAVAINGHDGPVRGAPEGRTAMELLPYQMAVWYGGDPVGLLHPFGGVITARGGPLVNEDALIEALRDRLDALRAGVEA